MNLRDEGDRPTFHIKNKWLEWGREVAGKWDDLDASLREYFIVNPSTLFPPWDYRIPAICI